MSLEMKQADAKRAFVKKRSKVTASEVRKHVISGLLPIQRLADGENGFDLDISMMGKVVFTEPVPPIDVETLLEQRKTCLLYSISSPKSSKPIFEYVSDDVDVNIIRQDGLSDHNYTTIPNIENHVRDICAFYCDDFSLVNRKHAQLGTEDIKDRWNLEKLTALRILRPQLFHSGLRVMDREPSTISLDGPTYDLSDPTKFASEHFYVSMLKKSAIDKNTLLYSMLSKNRVRHFMNCINAEEKEWKWEKRGIPRLPEQEETPKLFVKVEKASTDPFFEPLFVSMAVYDIRNKQKVTESVYFNIADHDKLDMLGRNQPNYMNNNLQSLFNITGTLSDMFLVIKVEKVLQQIDVFDGSEPYTGTKEERNLEKLKSTAEDFCQRLGAYRTPLGFQVIDIQRIFNANVTASVCGTDRRTDPMIASSCTVNSGVILTTAGQIPEDRCSITSADRTSITSMGSTLRRFGSGTSAATVFSRVRTPLTRRKFAAPSVMSTSRDVPDCLDNMPSCSLKFSTFFRQEGDKTSEEDIYRICNEVRKAHGKVNKKMFNFELELTLAGSNKSKECHSHGSNLTLSSDNMIHEAIEIPRYKSSLNKSYKNLLFVYPKHINLSNRTGNARNIMVKIELMDASETAQEAIFEKGAPRASLLKCGKTTVIYHNRTPHFTDEIKISVPCDLNDGHHLLFTVYHVSCKDGDSSSAENPIGYTWLPLYRNGKLRGGDFNLPVCGEKPPTSYGYLDANNALPNLKWIDNHKPIFACSTKVISSVHSQDDHLEKFLTGVASLSSNDTKKPPVGEAELITSIDNLLKTAPDKLVAFIHFILSRLLFLIANPPYTDELSTKSFECIGNLVKLFSRMLDSDIDGHSRSMLLASFVKYRKQASQESKPHSTIRPVEMKSSPTDSNMLNSMIEHVERTHSSSNVGATNVKLHESLLEIWLRARGSSRENSIVHSWFLMEVILKSCSEYLTMTGRIFSSRKIRFGEQFLKNIETLIEILAQEVINRQGNDFEEAKMISNSLGYFLRDCFSIMDRTFVMKLVHKYLTAFSESMKKLPHSTDLLSIKVDFIRTVCSYEHYLIVNILNDIELPVEGASIGATPPKSSLTGSRTKNSTASWILTDSSRSTHYLSGQVLSDVRDAIASGNATLCAKAIETVKELMQSHELDHRIAEGDSVSQVANIYKPLVGLVLDNIDCLFSGSIRNSADVSSTNSFVEQTLRQDVMTAIAGKLRNSPDPHFGKLQMDLSMTKSFLCCMFWVLRHIDRADLQDWIVYLDHENMLKLLHLLYYTMSTFEIREETNTSRRSPDKTSLTKLDEEPEPGEVKWRTRSSDTCDSRADQLTSLEAVSSDVIVSCEVFMCVVEIIDNIITASIEKNSQLHILPLVFPIIMHGLSCNVSDQVLEVLFAAQQNFFAKFPAMILEQKPELCAELSQQILRHCSSTKLENVRTMATVSLYHFLRENYKLYKNLTRARTFLSTALSTLLSGSCSVDIFVNDEFMTKSLEIANQLAAEDDTFDETTKKKVTEQLGELTANLKKIMLSTVRMREHVNDYEMTIDLMYQLVEGYSNNPDLRITWLLNMAERHEKQRNLCEAAHSNLQACALVFEYIDQRNQNLAFESKGASTFAEITPNAIKESKTNFNSLKNADNENHIQSYHFTEAGLVKILEKAFSLLEKAQLYELLFPFSKIILNYCHATKCYSRVAHIHKRLSVAADQIKETGEFYESQSDPWLSPLPGIDKRCFGTFFRVAFYGKLFRELDTKEFVYKESAFSKLNEISNRLETFYSNMFGEGNVVVLKDSKQVEVAKLNEDKAYIQITFVDVFLSDDERMERSTYFQRRNNVNRFFFETPYTMEGRAQGDLSSQYKKRTILTVENSFPYIKTRLRVVNRTVMNFSPIEVAIEDIEKKTRELAAAAQHKNPKMLSMLVQGSIGTTVNQGPLEIANVFLANSMTDERGRPIDRLQNKLRLSFRHLQFRAMEAIQLSRQLIGEDQKEYQENVEANFQSFVTHLKPMLTREKNEITISEFGKPTVV